MLDKQDHVIGYRSSSAASEGGKKNFTSGANPRFNDLPEGDDDDDDWELDDTVGDKAFPRVGMKRNLRDLQDESPVKKCKVPTTVAKAVELAQQSVRTFTVPAEAAPSSKVRRRRS